MCPFALLTTRTRCVSPERMNTTAPLARRCVVCRADSGRLIEVTADGLRWRCGTCGREWLTAGDWL